MHDKSYTYKHLILAICIDLLLSPATNNVVGTHI